jgi:hypothetical protein
MPDDSKTTKCNHEGKIWCSVCGWRLPPGTDRARARIVAAVLSEHGISVTPDDEATLDDVEFERWVACVEIVRRLFHPEDWRQERDALNEKATGTPI